MREVSTRLRSTFARRADALRSSAALVSPTGPSAGLDDAHAAAERQAFEACAEPCRAPAPALHPLCLCPAPSDPMLARPALQPHQVESTSKACPAHSRSTRSSSWMPVGPSAPGRTRDRPPCPVLIAHTPLALATLLPTVLRILQHSRQSTHFGDRLMLSKLSCTP